MRKIFIYLLFLSAISSLKAQMYIGPKLGINYASMVYGDEDYLSDNNYKVDPLVLYQGGLILHYAVNKRWSLHTEVNYTKKGRRLVSEDSLYMSDRLECTYLEVPILFRFSFGTEQIRFYFNVGPHISYHLYGEGSFSSAVLRRGLPYEADQEYVNSLNDDILLYSIGNETSQENRRNIETDIFNTLQLGLDFGTGISIPIVNEGNLLFIDFRYGHTQSFLGQNTQLSGENASRFLRGLNPNLEGAVRTFSVSLGFAISLGNIYSIR